MSDSEAEYKSASEGSDGDNGWEVDSDFDFSNIEPQFAVTKSSDILTTEEDKEQNTCENKDTKLSGPSSKSNITPTILSNLDRLSIVNKTFQEQVFEESKNLQNESSCNQSSNVSSIFIRIITVCSGGNI